MSSDLVKTEELQEMMDKINNDSFFAYLVCEKNVLIKKLYKEYLDFCMQTSEEKKDLKVDFDELKKGFRTLPSGLDKLEKMLKEEYGKYHMFGEEFIDSVFARFKKEENL